MEFVIVSLDLSDWGQCASKDAASTSNGMEQIVYVNRTMCIRTLLADPVHKECQLIQEEQLVSVVIGQIYLIWQISDVWLCLRIVDLMMIIQISSVILAIREMEQGVSILVLKEPSLILKEIVPVLVENILMVGFVNNLFHARLNHLGIRRP